MTIDSLSYFGGRGVGRVGGRTDGRVVFVPRTAPGDRVRVRVVADKGRFLEAELTEILENSPHRREPPCRYFERCGGCAWQHVDYRTQSEQKEKIVRDSFRRLEKRAPIEWLPFIKAPDEFGYRNRIQVQTQGSDFGFFARRTRELVKIDRCLIAEDAINRELKDLEPDPNSRKIEIALQPDGQVRVMPNERDPEAALFSQVNSKQNEALISRLLALIRVEPDWILDLYAGSGNLTCSLRERFPGVPIRAVELSRGAVARGRAELPDVEWLAEDVEAALRRMRRPAGRGLVVLDPPRAGVSAQVVESLARLSPEQILYVSCNPSTAARDIERWLERGGLPLQKVQGLDMFPQTEHVEIVASLCGAI